MYQNTPYFFHKLLESPTCSCFEIWWISESKFYELLVIPKAHISFIELIFIQSRVFIKIIIFCACKFGWAANFCLLNSKVSVILPDVKSWLCCCWFSTNDDLPYLVWSNDPLNVSSPHTIPESMRSNGTPIRNSFSLLGFSQYHPQLVKDRHITLWIHSSAAAATSLTKNR